MAPNGKTDSMYTTGFAAIFIIVTLHQLLMIIGTRHWNWLIIFGYVCQYIEFMPIMVAFNDIAKKTAMYKTTWFNIFHEP